MDEPASECDLAVSFLQPTHRHRHLSLGSSDSKAVIPPYGLST